MQGGAFPTAKESFTMDERVLRELESGDTRPAPEHAETAEAEFGSYAPKPA